MERTQKANILAALVVAGLLTATLYHLFLGKVLGMSYPANTFLFVPEARFSDFSDIFAPVQQGSPLAGRASVYFPFAYIPLFPLAAFTWPVAYAIVLILFVVAIVGFFWCELDALPSAKRVAAAIAVPCCSFPVLFCADRGNIEFIVVLFEIGFLRLFARGRYGWSAVPLAAAIAMKLYPGALGVLLLSRRQYRAAALTATLSLILTLAAAAAYPGGIVGTISLMQLRLVYLHDAFIANPLTYSHSTNLLALVKLAFHATHRNFTGHSGILLEIYSIGSAVIFAVVAWYAGRHERVLWKQLYLLIALTIVLPQVSFDYKLIHLLLPTALFLAAPADRRRDDMVYLTLLTLLLVPKRYFPVGSEASVSVLLNPIALCAMAAHIMARGRFGRSPSAASAMSPAELPAA